MQASVATAARLDHALQRQQSTHVASARARHPLGGRQFIPGPMGLPFVGSARDFNEDALAFCTNAARNYGDVVRWRMVGQRMSA